MNNNRFLHLYDEKKINLTVNENNIVALDEINSR